jgi:uncharacterized membrane protein YfcA
VVTFTFLSIHQRGPIAAAWTTGVAPGIGGLAGAYTGARIQGRLPEALIRRMVGVLVIAVGARCLWSGLNWTIYGKQLLIYLRNHRLLLGCGENSR